MNLRRLGAVLTLELHTLVRRPMLWGLIFVIGLMVWGLSTGDMKLGTGTGFVGGTRAWITSEYSNAFSVAVMVTTLYALFVSIIAGMAVIRDDELKVGEMLHASPLNPAEYIWGKFLAVVAAFGAVMGAHLLLSVMFNHIVPNAAAAGIRGPFELMNYLRPALFFGLPIVVFFGGVTFYLGERWRRPAWAFLFPIAAITVIFVLLWNWSPSWLGLGANRWLMWIDPSGWRWLNETWLRMDRGVDFYNTQRIGLDAGFLISRLVFVALGLGFVALAQRHLAKSLRGATASRRQAKRVPVQPRAIEALGSLASVGMRRRPPRFVSAMVHTMRLELSVIFREPVLYLFASFVMMEALLVALLANGAFQTRVLMTSGRFAVGTMNTLSFLVCLVLMFYTVESIEREGASGLRSIFYSSPMSTGAILLGKALASSLVGVAILVSNVVACALTLRIQGMTSLEWTPFALVWGLLLLPTFLAWTALIVAVRAISGDRYLTYGVGIGVIGLTLYRQFTDGLTWLTNWLLWGAPIWSDMGALEFNTRAILLNRLMILGLAVLFAVIAVRALRRREPDAHAYFALLRPRTLIRGALGILPFALAPIALGSALWMGVSGGFQGEAYESDLKDYWTQNMATWRDALQPSRVAVDLDVELEPLRSEFRLKGTYTMVNPHDQPLPRFALTGGRNWTDVAWTMDGVDYEPDDRSRLYVFTPDAPLAPGDRVTVGFSYSARWPDGLTENGGGAMEFVLPSGVVLSSAFSAHFVPLVGYEKSIGVTEDNKYEQAERVKGFHEQRLPPALGSSTPFSTRIRITAPEEYTVNSVGVLTDQSALDGRRTVVWESDHPVRIFNIVAGRYEVRQGDGTAIYYHAGHDFNMDEMARVLDGAKRYFSEWFYPFPWQELRMSEFPGYANYGAGFPTNLVFSESIGFLTRPDAKSNAVFLVTAHETAHQWWANILTPADVPGGQLLSEGMSHFSTLLLSEQLQGQQSRMELSKRFEEEYNARRVRDAERALSLLDGDRRGDRVLWYNKGGIALWMLMETMGREEMFEGLRAFIDTWKDGPDFPAVQDFTEFMRPFAKDPGSYDRFVDQWIYDVVLPEYRLTDAVRTERGGQFEVAVTVENNGDGRTPVEVAAASGKRFDDDGNVHADYRETRQTVELGPGERRTLRFVSDFSPQRVVVDPDVRMLQFRRKTAVVEL